MAECGYWFAEAHFQADPSDAVMDCVCPQATNNKNKLQFSIKNLEQDPLLLFSLLGLWLVCMQSNIK